MCWGCCWLSSILCWGHYLVPLPYTKYANRVMKDNFKQISPCSTNHKNPFGDFSRQGIKTRKGWPNFFKFQSLSILAIRYTRQQETLSMPKYSPKWQNWNIIFGIWLIWRPVLTFLKWGNVVLRSSFKRYRFTLPTWSYQFALGFAQDWDQAFHSTVQRLKKILRENLDQTQNRKVEKAALVALLLLITNLLLILLQLH